MNKPFKKNTLYISFIECKEENESEDQWNFLKKAIWTVRNNIPVLL